MVSCFSGFFPFPLFCPSDVPSFNLPLASRSLILVVSELPYERLTQAFRKWKSKLAVADGGFACRMQRRPAARLEQ
jgi:hypothetical protein